jgi:hypothetical protein
MRVFKKESLLLVPEQKKPSPVIPSLQAQVKDPGVLVQFALTWQGLNVHSLISK